MLLLCLLAHLRRHHDSAVVTFIDLTTLSVQHIQYFGEPFFFLIRDGEALSDIKVRIQKRLQVPDEQFLKVLISPLLYGIYCSFKVIPPTPTAHGWHCCIHTIHFLILIGRLCGMV
jgi:hypothetical protein